MTNPFQIVRSAPSSAIGGQQGGQYKVNTSVSQTEAAGLCPRKWWLSAVAKVKEPQRRHFYIGEQLHAAAERFLRADAEVFPTGWDAGLETEEGAWIQSRIQEAIAQGILAITPGNRIEWPFCMLVGDHLLDARGVPLLADAQVRTTKEGVRVIQPPTKLLDGSPLPARWDDMPHLVGFIDETVIEGVPPSVSDQKSAKNKRWGKRRADVLEGLQMPVYSLVPFAMSQAEICRGIYKVYLKSEETPSVYQVDENISLDCAVGRWRSVIETNRWMQTWRKAAPLVHDKTHPGRAANYWQVAGYMDQEPKPCEAFGGCPHKPLCYGWKNHEQHVRTMDLALNSTPTCPKSVHQTTHPVPRFANVVRDRIQQQEKETAMPFGKPLPPPVSLTVGGTIYVPEPDTTNCYLARVLKFVGLGENTQVEVAFQPDLEVLPVWDQLPEAYKATIPAMSCLPSSDGLQEVSYRQALRNANMAAPDYQGTAVTPPPPPPPPPPPAPAPATKPKLPPLPQADQTKSSLNGPDALDYAEDEHEADVLATLRVIESHSCWVGQNVHITNQGGKNTFRGLCTDVTAEGMVIEGFGSPIGWANIETVVPMNQEATPGDPKDEERVTKEKEIQALGTVAECLGSMQEIMTSRAEKKTFGKKDFIKLQTYLDRAKELGASGAPMAAAVVGDPKGFAQGYIMALDDVANNLGELRLKVVI